MDFYTEDLINEINSTEECDFIACAVTFLHAIGINAAIKQLFDQGIRLKGYVLILAHPTTGRILKEEDFQLDNTDIVVRNYADRYRECHHVAFKGRWLAIKEASKKKQVKKIYVVWTELDYRWYEIMTHIKWSYQLCYIRIDDGGGSYVDQFKNSFMVEMYERISSRFDKCKAFYRIFFRCSFNKILQKQLISHGNYIDNRIFRASGHNQGIFTPNEEIIPYYRAEFKRIGRTIPKEVISICSAAVLVNTQCLAENKITDGHLDLNLYEKVVDIAREIGLSVVLKPHPRELNVEKYKRLRIKLIPSDTAQEAILANLEEKPKCIVSIFSSALLNAWGLFDIPAISLAKIMLKEDINEEFRRQLMDFIKQYNGVFLFPESYEKFKNAIQSL